MPTTIYYGVRLEGEVVAVYDVEGDAQIAAPSYGANPEDAGELTESELLELGLAEPPGDAIYVFTFADEAAREAGTGYDLQAGDIGKVARQLSDETFWILTDASPITWSAMGGGGPTTQFQVEGSGGPEVLELTGWGNNEFLYRGGDNNVNGRGQTDIRAGGLIDAGDGAELALDGTADGSVVMRNGDNRLLGRNPAPAWVAVVDEENVAAGRYLYYVDLSGGSVEVTLADDIGRNGCEATFYVSNGGGGSNSLTINANAIRVGATILTSVTLTNAATDDHVKLRFNSHTAIDEYQWCLESVRGTRS